MDQWINGSMEYWINGLVFPNTPEIHYSNNPLFINNLTQNPPKSVSIFMNNAG